MGTFRQLGDPVCPDCLCQHHGAAYSDMVAIGNTTTPTVDALAIADAATITNVQITITETCCVVGNAAVLTNISTPLAGIEIERPTGTIRTSQENEVITSSLRLYHYASWEVLPPGVYLYSLMNRIGGAIIIHAAWLKVIASDCEG